MFTLSETWQNTYPTAVVGVLAMQNVVNPKENVLLDQQKEQLETELRDRFADYDRPALRAANNMSASVGANWRRKRGI